MTPQPSFALPLALLCALVIGACDTEPPPEAPPPVVSREARLAAGEIILNELKSELVTRAQNSLAGQTDAEQAIHLHDDTPRLDLPEALPSKSVVTYLRGASLRVPFGVRAVDLSLAEGQSALTLDYGDLQIIAYDRTGSAAATAELQGWLTQGRVPWAQLEGSISKRVDAAARAKGVENGAVTAAMGGYQVAWGQLEAQWEAAAGEPSRLFWDALWTRPEDLREATTAEQAHSLIRRWNLRTALVTARPEGLVGGPHLVLAGPSVGLAYGGDAGGPLFIRMAGKDGARIDAEVTGGPLSDPRLEGVLGVIRPYEVRSRDTNAIDRAVVKEQAPVRRALYRIALLHLDPTPIRAMALIKEYPLGGMTPRSQASLSTLAEQLATFTQATLEQRQTLLKAAGAPQ